MQELTDHRIPNVKIFFMDINYFLCKPMECSEDLKSFFKLLKETAKEKYEVNGKQVIISQVNNIIFIDNEAYEAKIINLTKETKESLLTILIHEEKEDNASFYLKGALDWIRK